MTNKDLTYIIVILDRSYSMTAIQAEMQDALNKFIEDQRKEPGEARVTFVQFDDLYDRVFTDRPIGEVPKINLEPRGTTALLDALGRTINETGERLAAMTEEQRPGLVTIVTITDGLENASREFDLEHVRKIIEHQREQYGWLFVYLGANQDAIRVGEAMGFRRGQTMTYAPTKRGLINTTDSTTALLANARHSVAGGQSAWQASASANYSDEDRESAVEK